MRITLAVAVACLSLGRLAASAADSGESTSQNAPAASDGASASNEASQDILLAQVDQGKGSSPSSIREQNSTSQGNANTPSGGLEEIVVTAQKRMERLQDVPISISVLSGTALNESTFAGSMDALSSVPGVSLFPTPNVGGNTSLVIRGVPSAKTGEGAPTVGFYVDGVPFGFVTSGLSPDLSPYDLKRIEVLRGPQGTLYGANALNGVVRVLTNDPDLNNFGVTGRVSTSFTQSGGTNYGGDAAINIPLVDGKLALRAVAGYQDLSGWIDSPVKNDVNWAHITNARVKLSAQPTDELSIGLSFWQNRLHQNFGDEGDDSGRVLSIVPNPIDNTLEASGLKVGYLLPGVSFSSETSYLSYLNNFTSDLAPLFGLPAPSLYPNSHGAHVFSEEILLGSRDPGPWRWTAGAMYRRASEDFVQTLTQFGYDNLEDQVSKSAAVYGELTRTFLEGRVELTAGLRYFHDDFAQHVDANFLNPNETIQYTEDTFKHVTPRAVLTWHLGPTSTSYASFSEGFRSGFSQSAQLASLGYRPVGPDELKNYELGTKGSLFDQRVSYDFAVYYQKWLNVQTSQGIIFNALPYAAFINGTSASGVGVDVGLTARPLQNLSVSIGYSWNRLSQDANVYSGAAGTPNAGNVAYYKGDRLPNAPGRTGSASVEYSIPFGGTGVVARLSAGASYISPSSENSAGIGVVPNTFYNESMLDVRGGLTIDVRQRWSAKLYIDNATNYQGTPARSIYIPTWDARVRPRTLGLQLAYHP
jgi:iron complex outermembrane receptor protein